jgi:hypothetical protein
MRGMIDSFLTQLSKALHEQAELDIQKQSRNTALACNPLLGACKDILRAYVIEPTKPNLPRAEKGYLRANQVKSIEEVQALKFEVLNHLDSLKTKAQYFSLFGFRQKDLFNETVDKIKIALKDPNSEAILFLRHRKRQLSFDKSASRMASFLLAYYIIDRIKSAEDAELALNAIHSLDRSSAFGNRDLYNNFILPIKKPLQIVYSLYKGNNNEIREILKQPKETYQEIEHTFAIEFIKEAKAAKRAFRRVAALPDEVKQLFTAYEADHQKEQQLLDQIKALDNEYLSLIHDQNTSNNKATFKQKLAVITSIMQEKTRTQDHKKALEKRIEEAGKDLNPQENDSFRRLYKLTFGDLDLVDSIAVIETALGTNYLHTTFIRALEACQTVIPQSIRITSLYSLDQEDITGVTVSLASQSALALPFRQNLSRPTSSQTQAELS